MPIFRVKLKAVRVFVSVAMSNDWIDGEGFRANVGIILTDVDGRPCRQQGLAVSARRRAGW